MPPQGLQHSDLPQMLHHSHPLAEGHWPVSCWSRGCSHPCLQPSLAKPLSLLLRGDLRLKEYENEDKQGRQNGSKHHPHGELCIQTHGVNDPAPGGGVGHLEATGH